MDTSLFILKPAIDTCDCIICHRKGVKASDEHIIPKSLGGYAHSWKVCKDCNSKFGSAVDIKLINHYMIAWERYFHQLKGESNTAVKSPLEGTFKGKDGEPYKVVEDKGVMTPHMLRPVFNLSPDGKHLSMAVDPATKNPERILEKYCKDNGIDYDPTQVTTSKVKEVKSPWLTINTTIDLSSFRMGILKIAYEFTAELIPDYLDDAEAVKIADILEHACYDRIDDVVFGGNGISDIFPMIFKDVIDFANNKRHYLLLTNVGGKMCCFVKLFNVFCLGIKMSDKPYSMAEDNIILVNDFGKQQIDLFTLEELITKVTHFNDTTYHFMGNWDSKLQLIAGMKGIGIYSAEDGHNLCLTTDGQIMGSLSKILPTIPDTMVDNQFHSGKSIATYHINGLFCFCLAPTQELIPVKEVVLESSINKF